jgi:hypothetical protein
MNIRTFAWSAAAVVAGVIAAGLIMDAGRRNFPLIARAHAGYDS